MLDFLINLFCYILCKFVWIFCVAQVEGAAQWLPRANPASCLYCAQDKFLQRPINLSYLILYLLSYLISHYYLNVYWNGNFCEVVTIMTVLDILSVWYSINHIDRIYHKDFRLYLHTIYGTRSIRYQSHITEYRYVVYCGPTGTWYSVITFFMAHRSLLVTISYIASCLKSRNICFFL